jgi:hypothetical protein
MKLPNSHTSAARLLRGVVVLLCGMIAPNRGFGNGDEESFSEEKIDFFEPNP